MELAPHPSACLYPFLSLTVSAVGDVELCCTTTFKVGSLRTHTFQELWSGPVFDDVRRAMLEGRELKACKSCYQAERDGLLSKRIKFHHSRRRVLGEEACRSAFDLREPVVSHLDISFSNVCNLSCVMCMSRYSTSWFAKDQKALEEGLFFRTFREGPFEPNRLSDERIDELVERFVPQLRTIIIKGGEPFMETQCLSFLKKLSRSTARRKDLVVNIQTNATRVNDEILEAVDGLNLEIGISMDGTADFYRWIRGFDFEKVIANVARLNQSRAVVKMGLDFTASAFNVHQLLGFGRFALELAREYPKIFACSFINWARQEYLSPTLIPLDEREAIADELQGLWRTDPFFEGIGAMTDLLRRPQSGEEDLEKFRRWTDFCNRMRGFEIQRLEPRLLRALKPHRADVL